MRFVLYSDALSGDDETLRLLDRLVDRVADEVHRIEIPDADLLEASRWFTTARPTRRKIVTTAVAVPPRKQSHASTPHVKRMEVRNHNDARIADKLAHAPFVILVEDREADGLLLEILIGVLGVPELKELWARAQVATPRAIELDTAGGLGSMPQRVRRAAEDAATEGRPLRLFVLCDSDARWPGDPGTSHANIEELRELCTKLSIPLHVLAKRNAENYIPDAVFEGARDDPRNVTHVARFDALLKLRSPQRDHFPLKDGLSDEERIQALRVGLYAPEEEPDLLLLKQRLFRKKPRLLVQVWDERRAQFTAAGLRARDGNGEIDTLLAAISREL